MKDSEVPSINAEIMPENKKHIFKKKSWVRFSYSAAHNS